ncbi:hypothetical protein K2173_000196 [Erythroxylum novogranatense]|uniref:non-specific serine/threonine protein kinase n=1 Tax=Erythroxylum novogranatense TaxID=1862640 RepID=A0AAV8SNT5_9ROSI|nr:hypothetical protein K2173_000196 [Erythroxylum novogranatense]
MVAISTQHGMEMFSHKTMGSIFMISFCCFVFVAVALEMHPAEVNALLAVKDGLIDPMKRLRNWNIGDPCTSQWTGVLCSNTSEADGYLHVLELQLLNMNLSGTLAPRLGELSYLTLLDFMWNNLTGSIPKEIGKISSLKLLLLNGNLLSGSLPDELGFLSNLNRLQVDQNQLSGPLPKSFANLSSMRHLHLNNNSISGQIPYELSQISTLLHLLLDNNNLTGYLPPELSALPELRILQLDNNDFGGSEIPATYGNFSKLAKLSLRNCSLKGTIPDLSNIRNLYYLDLRRNELTGLVPSGLSNIMRTIDLSYNNLNGTISESFSNLPFLQKLSLKNNSLSGSIPSDIWQDKSFSPKARLKLDLRNNLFTNILGELNPPVNVSLRLDGNPICNNASVTNVGQFCGSVEEGDGKNGMSGNSTCPIQSCPTDNFFEYVPGSPKPCFCASPLTVDYRLKSPSFSYFPPYIDQFEGYITECLKLDLYQFYIDSYAWEESRLRMHLKLFPNLNNAHPNTFNRTEVLRIRRIFASWKFAGSDFFGPYELLNFTLEGPYAQMGVEIRKSNISKGVWAAIILGAIACAIAASAVTTLVLVRRHARYLHKFSRRHMSSKASMKIEGIKAFTFKEMAMATDNFNSSSQVGQGGYGKVYRGILADKTVVAIKRAEEGSLQGQKEFLTEIKLLSRLHHRNLVSLIGYCDEEEEQMLVYEFMPNGTLRDWLADKATENLKFVMRLNVALGSAKGILYLHTEAQPPVFHRDIKASNILLDSKLTAKVADFGLSRLAPVLDDQGNLPNHISTVVKGTPGYVDPEYFLTHKLTDKSDVYSLGIVFLELLTGMRPISHGKNIVREVKTAHEAGMMFSIVDSRMGSYPAECVERFVGLAIMCCQDVTEKRPSMAEVVRELENILKMMPEEEDSMHAESSSSTTYPGTESSSSRSRSKALFYGFGSSGTSVLGSDLTSGTIPSISPR